MPTSNFSITSDANDGMGHFTGATFPPSSAFAADDGDVVSIDTSFFSAVYAIYNGFMRWNTSSLSGNTVTSAILRVEVMDLNNVDGLSVAGDWYDFGGEPSVSGDMESTSSGNAFAATNISTLSVGSKDFTLLNVSNINTTGFTGIRIAPAVGTTAPLDNHDNFVDFAAFEHATGAPPELVVTYTVAATSDSLTAFHGVGMGKW
jgi:hypothetical protein